MDIYLVGGAVRDVLCGRMPRDYDWAFAGTPEDFLQRYPAARKIVRDRDIFYLNHMEYARLNGTLTQDLATRDFTINALALDQNGRLFCHPQTLDDISARRIRPTSPTALQDDPIRTFRAARLAAQFPDHEICGETRDQMRSTAPLLHRVPAEQVGRETWKAMGAPRPSRFILLLAETGCLPIWFAELEYAADIPAGPPRWHNGSVLAHAVEVMDAVAPLGNPLATWMALCHDLGKTRTSQDILPHHYNHETRGVPLAQKLAERLRLPRRAVTAGMTSARQHMKAGRYHSLRPVTRVDLLMDLHKRELLDEMFAVALADSATPESKMPPPSPNPLLASARDELERILAVHLPEAARNKGEESARRLREMRAAALREP